MNEVLTMDILDRVLDPVTACLTPEVARRIADLRADAEMQARLDVLADKANEGALSPQEQAVYRQLVEALDVITVLQSKARRLLETPASA
jgi:hypothetical protein